MKNNYGGWVEYENDYGPYKWECPYGHRITFEEFSNCECVECENEYQEAEENNPTYNYN